MHVHRHRPEAFEHVPKEYFGEEIKSKRAQRGCAGALCVTSRDVMQN